jgi:uncharacterized protein
MNLLENLNTPEQLAERGLTWHNPPLGWQPLPGGGMRVNVPAQVDFFRDPAGVHNKANAAFLWTLVRGDFVARVLVRPPFTTTWDAGALMAFFNPLTWCKLCFEKTDLGTTAAVSVVTRGLSDDANGVNLTVPQVWLQLVRAGNVFGMYYSLSGDNWQMVRVFHLDDAPEVRVGLVAQCPAGPGTTIDFLHFSIEPRTVENLRAGV